jgi:hypothetical protein
MAAVARAISRRWGVIMPTTTTVTTPDGFTGEQTVGDPVPGNPSSIDGENVTVETTTTTFTGTDINGQYVQETVVETVSRSEREPHAIVERKKTRSRLLFRKKGDARAADIFSEITIDTYGRAGYGETYHSEFAHGDTYSVDIFRKTQHDKDGKFVSGEETHTFNMAKANGGDAKHEVKKRSWSDGRWGEWKPEAKK